MPGDPNQHIYLSDHYPTKAGKRLSYAAVGRLLVENGWPRDLKTLTTAIAVVTAESSRDPKGYLAYVDLGVDRNSAKGLAMRKKIDALPASTTLTTFRKR